MKSLHVLSLLLLPLAAVADGVTLPETERVVLENGAVLLLNEKHDVPLIGMEIIVPGGASVDPAGKYGVANLLAGVLEKGAGTRDAASFAEAIAAVGGELDADASLESLTVSAEFMAKDMALMVELTSDLLLRPTLSRGEFTKLRNRSVDLIKAAKGGNPGNLMPDYANAFLFGNHPYGNPVGGSEASLATISHADVLAYYKNQMGGDRLIIAVSGDFELAAMRELLTEAFGDWRAAAQAPIVIEAPTKTAGGRVLLIDKPGATQTYFRFGNLGVARDFPRRADLDLANTVFGGRFTSMLMTELRTKSGLSYGARSALTRSRLGGSVMINSFTQTSTTKDAVELAIEVLGRLHSDGLNDEMLTSAKNYVMGQFPPRFETASQIAGLLAMLEAYGLDAAYIDDYGGKLGATTTASVADVIAEVYPTDNDLVFVLLGDAAEVRGFAATLGVVTEMSITDPQFHAAE